MINITDKNDDHHYRWLCIQLRLHDPAAANYEDADIIESVQNSLCLWAFDFLGERCSPVGFMRILTDRSLVSTITDCFVIGAYQGSGVGTQLMLHALKHPNVKKTGIILSTKTAQGFYQKFGFRLFTDDVMLRPRP